MLFTILGLACFAAAVALEARLVRRVAALTASDDGFPGDSFGISLNLLGGAALVLLGVMILMIGGA